MIFGGIKNIIVALFVGLLVGGIAGWRVEAWRSNVAYYQAENLRLRTEIDAANTAAEADAQQFKQDAETIDELKRKVEDAQARTSSGECLPSDDADRVRDLFDGR